MSKDLTSASLELNPNDADVLIRFVGELNENLKIVEKTFKVKIFQNGNKISISGDEKNTKRASNAIKDLYESTSNGSELSKEQIQMVINKNTDLNPDAKSEDAEYQIIKTPKKIIKPRGNNQNIYISNMDKYEVNFGVGPAGTGKTYLAVAKAVEMLVNEDVKKIILIRPAVEAGEKLGFLPGDLSQKVDPYLRPLYDSLYDLLDFEKIQKKIEIGDIEIAPLAFMRGRTLKNSFAILDEAQNATDTQIKMFLTRIGENSKIVINGDPSQIDLPNKSSSGLVRSKKILGHLKEISTIDFDHLDVVRHPLVSKIVKAYSDDFKRNE